MPQPLIFTVIDSGPVDGVTVVEREIEFRINTQDRYQAKQVLSRDQYLWARDQNNLLVTWNRAFVIQAFVGFYDKYAAVLEKLHL